MIDFLLLHILKDIHHVVFSVWCSVRTRVLNTGNLVPLSGFWRQILAFLELFCTNFCFFSHILQMYFAYKIEKTTFSQSYIFLVPGPKLSAIVAISSDMCVSFAFKKWKFLLLFFRFTEGAPLSFYFSDKCLSIRGRRVYMCATWLFSLCSLGGVEVNCSLLLRVMLWCSVCVW